MRPARVGAVLVLAGLAATVALVATGGSGEPPGSLPVTVASATTPTPPSTTSSVPTIGLPDALTVVEGALDAWGEFGVTGDLVLLEPWFDPAGPQYRQLATEAEVLAASPVGPPPYSVVMIDPVVEEGAGETRVIGRVVFSRPGEGGQSFTWEVVVRGAGDRLRIWTVNELGDTG